MRQFAALYRQLDQTTSTNEKLHALVDYFGEAPPGDRLWAIALFTHRRPRRIVRATMLRQWASEESGIPLWLLEESYHVVGDLAETITLILPDKSALVPSGDQPLEFWINLLVRLRNQTGEQKEEAVKSAWRVMDPGERFVFNKIITGGFRVGVSERLVIRALGHFLNTDESTIALRLSGTWNPESISFHRLLVEDKPGEKESRPFPFYLAYPLEAEPDELGHPEEWQAERKWDGIRGQLIVRSGKLFTWTRGGELVTDKYPEYHPLAHQMDSAVVDGEILPFKDGSPLPFQALQTRIGRKQLTRKLLETTPVIFMAYDLLEIGSRDIRHEPLERRRVLLEGLVNKTGSSVLKLSKAVRFHTWEELASVREGSREHHCEGLMIKRKSSPYRDGRKRGDWWKWKVDPMVVDAVMIYAMRGHGRRSNLYTDYTFAVWDQDRLVPFAKAYSGLTDREILEVDRFVKQHTQERFGPVRRVEPVLVFEIAFEGINRSARHKSGVAVRFPRIHRWRKDKMAVEANRLEDLHTLIQER